MQAPRVVPLASHAPTARGLQIKRIVGRLSVLSCQPHGPSNPLPDLDAVLRRLPPDRDGGTPPPPPRSASPAAAGAVSPRKRAAARGALACVRKRARLGAAVPLPLPAGEARGGVPVRAAVTRPRTGSAAALEPPPKFAAGTDVVGGPHVGDGYRSGGLCGPGQAPCVSEGGEEDAAATAAAAAAAARSWLAFLQSGQACWVRAGEKAPQGVVGGPSSAC